MSRYGEALSDNARLVVHGRHIASHLHVSVLGKAVAYRRITSQAISLRVPTRNAPASGWVRVRSASGQVSARGGGSHFSYAWPAPVLSSVSPAVTSTEGAHFVVRGRWLQDTRHVTVDGSPVHGFTVEPGGRAVRFSYAETSETTAEIEIRTHRERASIHYRVVAPPKITTMEPTDGTVEGGTAVTIQGKYLSHPTEVTIGGRPATHVVGVDDKTVTAVAPAHRAGSVKVVVTTDIGNTGTTGAEAYRYGPVRPETWGAAQTIDPDAYVFQLACAASSFCMALDGGSRYLTSDGTTWTPPSPVTADGAQIGEALACSSADFCLSSYLGEVWAWDGSAWKHIESLPVTSGGPIPEVEAIDCTSLTFCVLMSTNYIWIFDGTSFSASVQPFGWQPVVPGERLEYPNFLGGVSCWADEHCEVVNDDGYLATLSDGKWMSDGRLATDSSTSFSVLTCSDSENCMAGTTGGDVISRSSATAHVLPAPIEALACTSPTSCLAAGYYTTATYEQSTWSTSAQSPERISAVSCVIDRTCGATNGHDIRSLSW